MLLIGAALTGVAGNAYAQDLTGTVPFDWSGPYIGIQGGHGWGENDAAAASEDDGSKSALAARGSDDVPLGDGKGSIAADGFAIGMHAGYNAQIDAFVLGFEADMEYAEIEGDSDVLAGPVRVGEIRQEIDWLSSLRARAGFAADRALFYATVGVAAGSVRITSDDSTGSELHDNDDKRVGWTAGGGLDYAVTDTVSARLEYRYTDLGEIDSGNADKSDGLVEADTRFHAIRAGLSWHF